MISGEKWTKEEEEILYAMVSQGKSLKKIKESLPCRTKDSIRGKIYRDHHKIFSENALETGLDEVEPTLPEYLKTSKGCSYLDEGFKQNLEICGKWKLPADVIGPKTSFKNARKILSLSDLHVPFTRWTNLMEIVNEHKDADIVVLNGDIFDGYAFSQYSKSKRIPPLEEYIAVLNLVRYLSENFPGVVIVSGNHDRRSGKAFNGSQLDSVTKTIFRPDLLARIANGEVLDENGNVVDLLKFHNVVYQTTESWYVRIGKTIFAHPDAYWGNHPGQTVTKLCDYFNNRLGNTAFDSIVIGHTHRCYKGVYNGKLLIEQGAMSSFMDYQHKSDLRFTHATNGYAVLYQDEEGNVNYKDSTFVYLGSELPISKEIL